MKGKINERGNLEIERAGKMKEQFCPHSDIKENFTPEVSPCGDWCPLFDEPGYFSDDVVFYDDECKGGTFLSICRTTMTFKRGDFTDERGQS